MKMKWNPASELSADNIGPAGKIRKILIGLN